MRDVLFVPKLRRNLFSMGLVSERNLSFVTFPRRCEFLTLSGKKVLEGTRSRKLYQLSVTMIPPKHATTLLPIDFAHIISNSTEEACITKSLEIDSVLIANSSKAHDDLVIWHERMGHVNIDTINKMSANDSFCCAQVFDQEVSKPTPKSDFQ